MSYTVSFEIGEKKYPRKVVVDDQRLAWCISDEIDDALQDLCENVARLFADSGHPMPDDFSTEFYEKCDVGGLRDAIILSAQDVMDCELVFDYPF